MNTGCYWWKKNAKISGTEFPKQFSNDRGRFDFGTIKGPFFEFPLIDSAAYVSGMFPLPLLLFIFLGFLVCLLGES